jgi:type IV pilus assembly protein PilC
VALLDAAHATLPLITVVVFGVSNFLKTTWWLWLPVIVVFVASLAIGRRISRPFALFVDGLKLKLPIFGELNLLLAVSRFAHNLAILYRSGIPILQALHLCQTLVGNTVVEEAVAGVEERVKAGDIISEAIRQEPIFPAMLLRMVIMGENTGNLDAALENVSGYYNQVIPRRVKKAITVMEPMLMVFLIFVVGAVALAIFLPILSIMGSIR